MQRLLIFICFVISTAANATKYAYVIGGAGDPPGDTTIFDEAVVKMGGKLKSGGYETEIAFDGDHETTKKLLRDNFTDPKDATGDNVQEMIAKLHHDLESGKIKSGDQILLTVITHGYAKEPGTAHPVALQGSTLDTGEFHSLLKLASAQNVRLALVDGSCFSGNTLDLAREFPNTCVITSTSATTVGGEDFNNGFADNLTTGENLEDAYLRARIGAKYGFPQISTPQGQAAQKRLSDVQNNVKLTRDEFTNIGMKCPNAFAMQLRQLSALAQGDSRIDPYTLDTLKQQTEAYTIARDKLVRALPYAAREITLPNGKVVNLIDFANFEGTLATIRKQAEAATTPEEKAEFTAFYKGLPELRKFRASLIKQDPEFAKLVKNPKLAVDLPDERELTAAVVDLGFTERMIYNQLYNNENSRGPAVGTNGKGLSACAAFTF